jgi:polar amino acid transport system substrate-binding protein
VIAKRKLSTGALFVLAVSTLVACSTGNAATGGPADPAVPTTDVTANLGRDDAAIALLPASVRQSGTLTLVQSVGAPPSAFYLSDNRTAVGIDVDFANAVAKELGLTYNRQVATFAAILPGLDSGKYDVGTGNFGVTDERRKTIDFVTYIDDGQGFAVLKGSPLTRVTNLDQLCGLNVGTGAGTTFETTLEQNAHVCADEGKKPYTVQSFADNASIDIALQQHHIDVIMSTINGLRYQATQQQNVEFLNEFHRLDVGFAFKKGSQLTPAFQAAVNQLIANGVYQQILRKWGVTDSAITRSQISPPELK